MFVAEHDSIRSIVWWPLRWTFAIKNGKKHRVHATRVFATPGLRSWSFLRINLIAHSRHFLAYALFASLWKISLRYVRAIAKARPGPARWKLFRRLLSLSTGALEIFVRRFPLCSPCSRLYRQLWNFRAVSSSLFLLFYISIYIRAEETGILGKYSNPFPSDSTVSLILINVTTTWINRKIRNKCTLVVLLWLCLKIWHKLTLLLFRCASPLLSFSTFYFNIPL